MATTFAFKFVESLERKDTKKDLATMADLRQRDLNMSPTEGRNTNNNNNNDSQQPQQLLLFPNPANLLDQQQSSGYVDSLQTGASGFHTNASSHGYSPPPQKSPDTNSTGAHLQEGGVVIMKNPITSSSSSYQNQSVIINPATGCQMGSFADVMHSLILQTQQIQEELARQQLLMQSAKSSEEERRKMILSFSLAPGSPAFKNMMAAMENENNKYASSSPTFPLMTSSSPAMTAAAKKTFFEDFVPEFASYLKDVVCSGPTNAAEVYALACEKYGCGTNTGIAKQLIDIDLDHIDWMTEQHGAFHTLILEMNSRFREISGGEKISAAAPVRADGEVNENDENNVGGGDHHENKNNNNNNNNSSSEFMRREHRLALLFSSVESGVFPSSIETKQFSAVLFEDSSKSPMIRDATENMTLASSHDNDNKIHNQKQQVSIRTPSVLSTSAVSHPPLRRKWRPVTLHDINQIMKSTEESMNSLLSTSSSSSSHHSYSAAAFSNQNHRSINTYRELFSNHHHHHQHPSPSLSSPTQILSIGTPTPSLINNNNNNTITTSNSQTQNQQHSIPSRPHSAIRPLVTVLDIGFKNVLNALSLHALLDVCIICFPNLTRLIIGDVGLDERAITVLCEAIDKMPNLVSIDLRGNKKLFASSARLLVETVERNPRILELRMNSENVPQRILTALTIAIACNTARKCPIDSTKKHQVTLQKTKKVKVSTSNLRSVRVFNETQNNNNETSSMMNPHQNAIEETGGSGVQVMEDHDRAERRRKDSQDEVHSGEDAGIGCFSAAVSFHPRPPSSKKTGSSQDEQKESFQRRNQQPQQQKNTKNNQQHHLLLHHRSSYVRECILRVGQSAIQLASDLGDEFFEQEFAKKFLLNEKVVAPEIQPTTAQAMLSKCHYFSNQSPPLAGNNNTNNQEYSSRNPSSLTSKEGSMNPNPQQQNNNDNSSKPPSLKEKKLINYFDHFLQRLDQRRIYLLRTAKHLESKVTFFDEKQQQEEISSSSSSSLFALNETDSIVVKEFFSRIFLLLEPWRIEKKSILRQATLLLEDRKEEEREAVYLQTRNNTETSKKIKRNSKKIPKNQDEDDDEEEDEEEDAEESQDETEPDQKKKCDQDDDDDDDDDDWDLSEEMQRRFEERRKLEAELERKRNEKFHPDASQNREQRIARDDSTLSTKTATIDASSLPTYAHCENPEQDFPTSNRSLGVAALREATKLLNAVRNKVLVHAVFKVSLDHRRILFNDISLRSTNVLTTAAQQGRSATVELRGYVQCTGEWWSDEDETKQNTKNSNNNKLHKLPSLTTQEGIAAHIQTLEDYLIEKHIKVSRRLVLLHDRMKYLEQEYATMVDECTDRYRSVAPFPFVVSSSKKSCKSQGNDNNDEKKKSLEEGSDDEMDEQDLLLNRETLSVLRSRYTSERRALFEEIFSLFPSSVSNFFLELFTSRIVSRWHNMQDVSDLILAMSTAPKRKSSSSSNAEANNILLLTYVADDVLNFQQQQDKECFAPRADNINTNNNNNDEERIFTAFPNKVSAARGTGGLLPVSFADSILPGPKKSDLVLNANMFGSATSLQQRQYQNSNVAALLLLRKESSRKFLGTNIGESNNNMSAHREEAIELILNNYSEGDLFEIIKRCIADEEAIRRTVIAVVCRKTLRDVFEE